MANLITTAGFALADLIEVDPVGTTPAELAAIINARPEGWTLDTPAPLGNWVRHEGVVFSAEELAEVVGVAETYLRAS